jgi:hypothetical protein
MSPVFSRARTSTGAGVIAITLLVLIFGNQVYTDWVSSHAKPGNAWDLFLTELAWPRWFFTKGGTASQDVIAFDVRALLLIVLVAVIIGMGADNVTGGGGAFMLGWFAVIIGAAVAGLLTAFITTTASAFTALQAAAGAATYGLFVGWLVGLAAAATVRRKVVASA